MNILDKKLQPDQCALIVGIPMTVEGFKADKLSDNKDFAKNKSDEAISILINELTPVMSAISETGMHVYRRGTFQTLVDVFAQGVALIIPFTHYLNSKGLLELVDGLYNDATIESAIPVDYSGILDLSVCNPTNLADRLNFNRQNLRVRRTRGNLHIPTWAWFYLVLAKILAAKPSTYLDAFAETVKAFLGKSDLPASSTSASSLSTDKEFQTLLLPKEHGA